MKTTLALPSAIIQFFSSDLLFYPFKIKNDETDLWKIWLYIEKKLWKKLDKTPGEKIKCEKLKNQFFEIYEQIKTKKEDPKEKINNKTENPFYFIECSNKIEQKILRGFR